jgi:hypothetical protein
VSVLAISNMIPEPLNGELAHVSHGVAPYMGEGVVTWVRW